MSMSLRKVAQETLTAVAEGFYVAPSGARVSIAADVARAVAGTVLFRPGELAALSPVGAAGPRIEVTGETTAAAGRRLAGESAGAVVGALNFASARNPGGGFLGGAKAQEEDLCRCSALYACLEPQAGYYEANRREPSTLYTDHLIVSPGVPFFRDDDYGLLERPVLLSIVTAPAPNAGAELGKDPSSAPAIRATLERRASLVLAAFARAGLRTIVLGAWGCGAFRCDPDDAAAAFARALEGARGAFDRVVFAVWERAGPGPNRAAFERRFGSGA